MATFRKITLQIAKLSGYGQYEISAKYRGKQIAVHSTNSEAYDWIHDNSNRQKHSEAKRACYYAIVAKYNKEYNPIH